MQQLLRYGIVCSVALMLVLPPKISSAQSQQLQEILDSAAEALDTAEAIAAKVGIPPPPSIHNARSTLAGLLLAPPNVPASTLQELATAIDAIGAELTRLSQAPQIAQEAASIACVVRTIIAGAVCASAIACIAPAIATAGAAIPLCVLEGIACVGANLDAQQACR